MTRTFYLAALGLGVLSGCAPMSVSNLAVHEVHLYGGASQRLVWAYGDLAEGKTVEANFGGQKVQLGRADSAGGPLRINDGVIYTEALRDTVALPKVTRTAQGLFDVSGSAGINKLYYTDGYSWFQLDDVSGQNVVARPVAGLNGIGELTPAEAAHLSRSLTSLGPVAVGVLAERSTPNARVRMTPTPQEHRLTALTVVPITTAPATTAPVRTPSTSHSGGNVSAGNVNYNIIARGTNAATDGATVQVATTPTQAAALYNLAYGRQSSRPSVPDIRGKTLVGIFMGMRSTGGYGLEVRGVNLSGNSAVIEVHETAPGPDMLTTQALTSPWVIVELSGTIADVDVRGLDSSAGGSFSGIEK